MMIHYQLLVSPQTPDRTSVVNLAAGENWLQLLHHVVVAPAAAGDYDNNDRRDDPVGGTVRPTIIRPHSAASDVEEEQPQQPPLAATNDCFLCFQYHRGLLWVKDMRYHHHKHHPREMSSAVSLQGRQAVWTASLLTSDSKERAVQDESAPAPAASEVPLGPRQAVWLKHGDRIRVTDTVTTTGNDDDLVPVVPPRTVWLEFHCSDAAARAEAADALAAAHRAMQWGKDDNRSHDGADTAEAPSAVSTDPHSQPSMAAADVTHEPLAAANETAGLLPPLPSPRGSHSPVAGPSSVVGDIDRRQEADVREAASVADPSVPPLPPAPMAQPQTVEPSEINLVDEGRSNTLYQSHRGDELPLPLAEEAPPPTPQEAVGLSPNKPDSAATTGAAKPDPSDADADADADAATDLDVGDTASDDDGGGRPDDDDGIDKNGEDPSIAQAPNDGTQQSQFSLGNGTATDDRRLREQFSAPSSEWLTQPTSQQGGTDGPATTAEDGRLGGRTARPLLGASQLDEAALTQEAYLDSLGATNENSSAAPPTDASVFTVKAEETCKEPPLTDPVGSSSHSSNYHLLVATDSQSHRASISGTVSDAASRLGGDTNAPEVAAAPPTPRIEHRDTQALSPAESHASSQPLLTPPGMSPSTNRRQEPPSFGAPRESPRKLLFQGIEPPSSGITSAQQQHGVQGGDQLNANNANASEVSDRSTHVQQLTPGVSNVDSGPVAPCPATDSQCYAAEEQSTIQSPKSDSEKQNMDVGSCEPSMLGESGALPEEGASAPTESPSGTSQERTLIDQNVLHQQSPKRAPLHQTPIYHSAEKNDNEPEPKVESAFGESEDDGETKPSRVPPTPRGRPPKKRATASKPTAPPSRSTSVKVPKPAGEASVRRSSRKRLPEAVVALSDQPEQVPASKKRRESACRNLNTDLEEENSSSGNSPTCYVLVTSLKEATSKKVAKMVPELGGVLLTDIREAHKCTHLIAGDGTDSLKRTPKLMIALNKTTNIVTLRWLLDSHAAGHLLPCQPYLILQDRKAEKAYGFVMSETLQRVNDHLRNGTSVLGGRCVHVCKSIFAHSRCPPPDELKLIVEAAGAHWVDRPQDLAVRGGAGRGDGGPLIVTHADGPPKRKAAGSDGDVAAALDYGAKPKSLQWLLRIMVTQVCDD